MKRARCILRAFGRLTRTDWAFLHFKAALGILLIIPLTQISQIKENTSVVFLCIWATLTIAGFWVSVIGLVMSAQRYEMRRKGFIWEMTGLFLLMSGPAAFGAVEVGIWVVTGQQKAVAVAFAYVIMAAIAARMIMVKGAAKSRTVIYKYTEKAEETDD